jgi:hypothetical protein
MRTFTNVSIPRAARKLCKQRDTVIAALQNGTLAEPEATLALSSMRVRCKDDLWSIRGDTRLPVLVRTTANGHTAVVKETASFVKRWWPLLPLVVLSLLALWGFATSTADQPREDANGTLPISPGANQP